MRILGFVLALASSVHVFGQSNFVVNTKLDIIYGDISFSNSTDDIYIKSDQNKLTLKPYQIKLIEIDGETYKPITLENRAVIAKEISKGKLASYKIRAEGSHQFAEEILIKDGGDYFKVPNIAFKKFASEYLSDCDQLSAKIKNGDLKRADLVEIVSEYNSNCFKITLDTELIEFSNLVTDIYSKLKKGEKVPSYLLKALEDYKDSDFKSLIQDVVSKIEE
ncbi:MAG: hypothetical protein AB8B73_04135 [Ekhidna sp.]